MRRFILILLTALLLTGCTSDEQISDEPRYITNIFKRSDSPMTEEEAAAVDFEVDSAYCKDGVFRMKLEEDDKYSLIFTANDGTETKIEDLAAFLRGTGSFSSIFGIEADDDGYLYIYGRDDIVCVSKDFSKIIPLTDSCGYVSELQRGADGKAYIIDIDYTDGAYIIPLSPSGADNENSYHIAESYIDIIDLGPDSAAYYLKGDRIYAWNPDTEPEVVMDISESGFLYQYIWNMEVSSRERIVFGYEEAFSEAVKYSTAVYEKAPDINLSKVQRITLATTEVDASLTRQISAFHAENHDVRIEIADYSDSGAAQLALDIQTGALEPDIYYGIPSDAQFRQYVDNGVFVDLSTLMEGESVYSKDNLFGAITRSYESGGELYGIPMTMEFTTVAANKAYVGDMTSWNASEMQEVSQSLSEGTYLFETVRQRGIEELLSADALTFYIDKDAKTCHFDSQQFVDLLEYIKNLPETKAEFAVRYDENSKDESMAVYREGKFNAKFWNGSSIEQFGDSFVYYGRENTVMIGYPVYDTEMQSGFIMKSDNPVMMIVNDEIKEYAWEFIKSCTTIMDSSDIPIWRSVYDELMSERTAFQQIFTWSGTSGYYGDDPNYVLWEVDEPHEIVRWDSDYREYIGNILDSAGAPVPVGGMYIQIAAIVTDEVTAYLAKHTTAEECAEKIQSRAQICMSEYLG